VCHRLLPVFSGLGGADPDGCSFTPRISADGHTVVFASDADNLVPGNATRNQDVFLADATTGVITRPSAISSGGQGNGPSFSPAINASGSEVTFTSFATNLDVDATNGEANVFLAGSHRRIA
jgi:Tol biopolymer transport system component